MGYTDNLNQLFDVPAIEQQKTQVIGYLNDYVKAVTDTSEKISQLETSFLGDAANLQKLAASTREAITLTKEQIASVKALADEKVKAAQADLLLQKTETENEKTKRASLLVEKELQRQYDENEKKRAKATQDLQKEANAYEQLKKQYNETASRAKALYIEQGKNNQATIDAIALAQKYHGQLMAAENAVGQFQRQVGNYNVVGAQFNQLLRELPNAGISAQTFLMALSNNITYFYEAVVAARAAGQSFSAIMGTLGASLMGPVGIINALVLGLTMFGSQMMNQKDILEEYTELVNKQAEALRKYNDELDKTFKGSDKQQIRELEIVRLQNEINKDRANGKNTFDKEKQLKQLELRSLNAEYETLRDTDPEKAFQIKKNAITKSGELDTLEAERNKYYTDLFTKDREKRIAILQKYREELLKGIEKTPNPNQIGAPFDITTDTGNPLLSTPLQKSGLFGDKQGTPQTQGQLTALYEALQYLEADEKMNKQREKDLKKQEDLEKKQLEQRLKNYRYFQQGMMSILDSIETVQRNKSDNDIARLEREREYLDKKTDREISAVERSTLSAEKKQERIDEISARAEQQRAMIAQREADRQQKQAEFEKGMAILKATIALYVGIAQEIEKGGVIGIGTGAAVAAYMATVIATLASTQVPAYAEGTDNHKGGLARVGDGGEHELIVLPSGKTMLSPDSDTLVNLPRGTQVIPVSDIEGMAGDKMTGIPILPMAYGDNAALANAIIQSNNTLNNTIKNKKETHFSWHNGELRKSVKNGKVWTTYLNGLNN